jgi:hypothetical protein
MQSGHMQYQTTLNSESKETKCTKGTLHAEYNSIDDMVLGPGTSYPPLLLLVHRELDFTLQSLKLLRFAPIPHVAYMRHV